VAVAAAVAILRVAVAVPTIRVVVVVVLILHLQAVAAIILQVVVEAGQELLAVLEVVLLEMAVLEYYHLFLAPVLIMLAAVVVAPPV
jgi:hypothetical protein